MKKTMYLCAISVLFSLKSFSQVNSEYNGGYKIKFNEDGSKYFRIIGRVQFWAAYNNKPNENDAKLNFSIRRARIITLTQLNKKFLLVAHLGLNSLNGNNQSPFGSGERSQIFFHDFYGEWKVTNFLSIGTGLHYWNGISRLSSQSTSSLLTLDNNRQSFATLGLSDQVVRHLGIFFKGRVKKLHYRFAVNEAGTSTLDTRNPSDVNATVYGGRRILGSGVAGKVYQGYVDYNFLDQESDFLPYKTGTYIGSKRVFNIGAGFFKHPNGVVKANGQADDVKIFAFDTFYDSPIGNKGAAITAYGVFQSNDYGENYFFNQYSTGNMIYGHLGYLIAAKKNKTRFQPYISYQTRSIKAIDNRAYRFGLGGNIILTGHHSKLTFEYARFQVGNSKTTNTLTVQTAIYL
ncbi:MAG: hypothetical protein ACK5H1_05260 [Tenacibaculum sp.]